MQTFGDFSDSNVYKRPPCMEGDLKERELCCVDAVGFGGRNIVDIDELG
jgi:hypothetical protein